MHVKMRDGLTGRLSIVDPNVVPICTEIRLNG